jgi:hypothetical protein
VELARIWVIRQMLPNIRLKVGFGWHYHQSRSDRIPVNPPPLIVLLAPISCVDRIAAIWNQAYLAISHVVSPHVRGQGRALLKQRFRPDFPSRIAFHSQGGVC